MPIDIDRQFGEQRARLGAEAQRQRKSVERTAREARERLRRQRSELEAQAERAKREAREAEAAERRKRELPLTEPVVVKAKEYIAEVEKKKGEAEAEIKKVEREVEEAKGKDIEAIAIAESETLAEIEKAEREFKVANVRLDTGEYVDKTAYNEMPSETQAKLKELGVEGYNRWVETEQLEFTKTHTALPTGEWVERANYEAMAPEAKTKLRELGVKKYNQWVESEQKKFEVAQTEFETDLQQSNPALYSVYKERGVDAYNAEIERLQGLTTKYTVTEKVTGEPADILIGVSTEELLAGKVAPAVGVGETVTYFDLPQAIEDGVPADTLRLLGFTQAQIDQPIQTQAVLEQLEPYKSGISKEEYDKLSLAEKAVVIPGISYDLPKFLRENPDFENKQLLVAGFTREAVDSAVEYNNQGWVKVTPGEAYFDAIKDISREDARQLGMFAVSGGRSGYGWLNEFLEKHPDIAKLQERAVGHPQTLKTPPLSLEAFIQAFKDARGYDKKDDDKHGTRGAELELLARMEYQRVYGAAVLSGSEFTKYASYLFVPARVLYPEVELKDISGLEWAVGGAQLALLAIPGIGLAGGATARATITGIEIVAGSIFATAIATEWSDMTPLERGISVAITVAILAPVGIRGIRGIGAVAERQSASVFRAQRTLNKAWSGLDNVKVKFGAESPQYIKALRGVESAQANLQRVVGNVAQSAGRAVKTAVTLARDAGVKARIMESALKRLRSVSVGSRNYARLVAKAQRAIEASRVADQRFIAQFNRLKALSARQLALLEKKSGIVGLKDAVVAVNKVQSRLEKMWAGADKVKARYGMDSPQYLKALQGVAKAKTRLTVALDNLGAKLRVRARVGPAAGWEAIIAQTEDDIARLRAEMSRFERLEKSAVVESAKKEIHGKWVETRDVLASKRAQLSEFIKARDGGIPAPMVARYLVRWETKPPTQTELRRLFKEFSDEWEKAKPVEPITPRPAEGVAPKAKVRVAVKERPVVVEKQLKLIPELEKVKPKPEPTVSAPRIKAEDVKIEYEPRYRERMFERPDVRDLEDALIVAIGVPLLGIQYGLKPAEITKIVPMVREDVAPMVKIITKATPDVIRETQRILAEAVREATRLKQQGKTAPQVSLAVQTYIKNLVKTITESAVKTEILAQVRPLTKTATKVATRIMPRVRVGIKPGKPRLFFPIIVKLPDGTSHTLTEEELASAVGWKQGFIYKAIWKPFGKNDITNTRKPVLGIPYYKGAGSAYRSIVRLGGKVPPVIARDMGIVDVYVYTPRRGKPRIAFKRDVGQKTKLTGRRHKTKFRAHTPEPTLGMVR